MSNEKIVIVDAEEMPYSEPLVGLLSIGSFLKHNGYNVILTEILKNNVEKIDKFVDNNTLCVCFGVKTNQIDAALKISHYIKLKYPNIKIIWGGVHCNLHAKQVIENENIDIVVFGDGEYTLFEIANALKKGKSLKDIKGCCYKKNSKIIFNKERDYTDISKLPQIDYSILEDVNKYLELSKTEFVSLKKSLPIIKNESYFPIFSNVGCPFNCTFCYSAKRKKLSARKIDTILDEIEYLKKKYNINFFRFITELFFYDKERVKEFIMKKKKRKLNFLWDGAFHINLLKGNFYSDEFLNELKKEGLVCTGAGAESGSLAQLKRYRKNITPDDILKVAERMEKLKIVTVYSFMIGAPYETYDDMIKTTSIIYKMMAIAPNYTHIQNVQVFRPYPGAELYQEAIKLGFKERKKLEDWCDVGQVSGYVSYKDLPYLRDNLTKIFNIFYYIKFVKGLYELPINYPNFKKNLNLILKNKTLTKIMTNKITINSIGLILRKTLENKLFDKYIIQKFFGRSLAMEK